MLMLLPALQYKVILHTQTRSYLLSNQPPHTYPDTANPHALTTPTPTLTECKSEPAVKRLRKVLPKVFMTLVTTSLSKMLDLSGTGHGVLKQKDMLLSTIG